MKTIYVMRHSEPLKPINLNNNDSLHINVKIKSHKYVKVKKS